jgi:D-sedoheptulose 7-phosphate isomerase
MNLNLNSRIDKFFEVIRNIEITDNHKNNYEIEMGINSLYSNLAKLRDCNKSLYIVGNGGSASVAAHATTDFFNVAKIRATTVHESSLLTCMSNDFGYENAFGKMLDQLLNPDDAVILISSSGKSQNIINAALCAAHKGAYVITLTGFSHDNPLRQLGNINIWFACNEYGLVEIGHQFILHNIADRFNKKLME